jgi:hypothetical protein
MLDRALDAGVPAAWASADEFYGGDRGLRRDLQGRHLFYVLAVAKSHQVDIGGPHGVARGDHIAATLSKRAWNRYSAGDGAKGRREYDWAWVAVMPPADEATGFHWLLIRRPHTRRRTGLLPLLQPDPRRATHPGSCRRHPLGRRVLFPEHERRRRPRPAPSQTMGLLARLHHTGHARRRDPHRHRRHRTPRGSPAGTDPVDRQRNPAHVRETDHHQNPTGRLHPGLVTMATHPPSPRPREPLPHPRLHRPSTKLYITFPGWTTTRTWNCAAPCRPRQMSQP